MSAPPPRIPQSAGERALRSTRGRLVRTQTLSSAFSILGRITAWLRPLRQGQALLRGAVTGFWCDQTQGLFLAYLFVLILYESVRRRVRDLTLFFRPVKGCYINFYKSRNSLPCQTNRVDRWPVFWAGRSTMGGGL